MNIRSFGDKLTKNYLGNVKRELKLNFEEGTEVYYSCGATLNGQNWIIGGNNEKRQASDLTVKHKKFMTVV